MLESLLSLSLESGALLVAVVSAVIALVLASVLRGAIVWLLVVLVPLAVAYCLYWLPVWLGEDPSEYSSWAPIIIIPWFVVGAVVSFVVAYSVNDIRRARS
jgi:hypothetical protein